MKCIRNPIFSPVDDAQQPPGRGLPKRKALSRGHGLREGQARGHRSKQRVDDVSSGPFPGGHGDAAAVPEGEGVAFLCWVDKGRGKRGRKRVSFFFFDPPDLGRERRRRRKMKRKKNSLSRLTPPGTAPTSPPATGPEATPDLSRDPQTAHIEQKRTLRSASAFPRRKQSGPPVAPRPRPPMAKSLPSLAQQLLGGVTDMRTRVTSQPR